MGIEQAVSDGDNMGKVQVIPPNAKRDGGAGRPSMEFTQSERLMVEMLLMVSVPHLHIREVLGATRGKEGRPIDQSTFKKQFHREIQTAKQKALTVTLNALMKNIRAGKEKSIMYALERVFKIDQMAAEEKETVIRFIEDRDDDA